MKCNFKFTNHLIFGAPMHLLVLIFKETNNLKLNQDLLLYFQVFNPLIYHEKLEIQVRDPIFYLHTKLNTNIVPILNN